MNSIQFPISSSCNFTEKDQIYHSLIEAALFNQNSNTFVLTMLSRLKNYIDKNGNDMIVDILFMKYLKKTRSKHFNDEIGKFNAKLIKDKKNMTQYCIAYICFNDPKSKFNFKNCIYEQSHKILTNELITVNGINISKVIAFYILKVLYNSFSKDSTINYDIFSNHNNNIKLFQNKHYDRLNSKEREEITKEYKKISKNIHQYYSLDFWKSVVLYQVMDDNTINVNDNPYLFHAAACLSYENPLIQTIFDIANFHLPDKISFDLIELLKNKLPLIDLLEMKPYSIEIKNLCTFIYFLVLNNVSFEKLDQYKNSMSLSSYQILQHVYKNYLNDNNFLDLSDLMTPKINIHDPNNFIMLHILRSINKTTYISYLVDQQDDDCQYILPKETDLISTTISSGCYGILKKVICKGSIIKNLKNNNYQYFEDDFSRFIQMAISNLDGQRMIDAMKLCICNSKNNERAVELVFELFYMKEYNAAIISLNNMESTNEIKSIVTDDLHFQSIKDLLKFADAEYSIEFIRKYGIEDILTQKEKIGIIFKDTREKCKIKVSRKNLLNDSIKVFENKDVKNKLIRVHYKLEEGIDAGGLVKDWFINVSNEIIKSNAFVPTPNGTSLTFNNKDNYLHIHKFTGQFIASSFSNKKNIILKLSSFIWKSIMNEKITLEDMKDYDKELYQSLKWISENDPKPLMMTFVNSDGQELCYNGRNKYVTESNKNEFIRLIIEKKLIQQNSQSIEKIKLGYEKIIDLNLISIFNANEINEIVNGKEVIDLEDWKKHTKYEFQYETKYNEFFTIISKWPQEKLKKLLKFSTGSSIVPVHGFKYFGSMGGLFTLNFLKDDSEMLPESHTCYNRIDIPCYKTTEKFEKKLALAIECDTFSIH